MNKETLIVCKHEVDKLMRSYEALGGKPQGTAELASKNAHAIYLLAEIVQALLKDKE